MNEKIKISYNLIFILGNLLFILFFILIITNIKSVLIGLYFLLFPVATILFVLKRYNSLIEKEKVNDSESKHAHLKFYTKSLVFTMVTYGILGLVLVNVRLFYVKISASIVFSMLLVFYIINFRKIKNIFHNKNYLILNTHNKLKIMKTITIILLLIGLILSINFLFILPNKKSSSLSIWIEELKSDNFCYLQNNLTSQLFYTKQTVVDVTIGVYNPNDFYVQAYALEYLNNINTRNISININANTKMYMVSLISLTPKTAYNYSLELYFKLSDINYTTYIRFYIIYYNINHVLLIYSNHYHII